MSDENLSWCRVDCIHFSPHQVQSRTLQSRHDELKMEKSAFQIFMNKISKLKKKPKKLIYEKLNGIRRPLNHFSRFSMTVETLNLHKTKWKN